jgi:hypothetical protein
MGAVRFGPVGVKVAMAALDEIEIALVARAHFREVDDRAGTIGTMLQLLRGRAIIPGNDPGTGGGSGGPGFEVFQSGTEGVRSEVGAMHLVLGEAAELLGDLLVGDRHRLLDRLAEAISETMLETAIAAPQPNVWNLTSVTGRPSP